MPGVLKRLSNSEGIFDSDTSSPRGNTVTKMSRLYSNIRGLTSVYPLLPMLVFQHFLAIVIVACCGTNAADDFLTAISNKLSSDIYIVASPTSVHVI